MSTELLESSSPDAPPGAQQVAQRALIPAALSCRNFIENGAGNPDVEALHRRIVLWVEGLPLGAELRTGEDATIRTPLGQLNEQLAIRGARDIEALAVAAWQLRLSRRARRGGSCHPGELPLRAVLASF